MNKEILALDKLVSYLERKDSVMAVEFVILYGTFARLWQIHASHGIPLGYEQSDSKGGIVIHSARVDISLDIVEKFADILYRRPIPELSTREADDFYLRPENAKTESIQEHERITIQGLFDTNAHRKNYDYAANRKKGDMDFAYVQYALRRYGEILYSQEELFKTDSDSAGNQIDMSSVFYEQDEYFHLIEDYEGILERKRLKKLLVKAEGVYLPHMEMLRDFFAHIDRYGGSKEIQEHFDSWYEIVPNEFDKKVAESMGMVNLKGHGKRIKSKYDCIRLYENGNVIWDIPNHPQYMVKLEYREGKDDKSFRLLKELLTAYPDELVIENFVETYGISFSRNSKRYDSIKTKLAICKCMERFIENISDGYGKRFEDEDFISNLFECHTDPIGNTRVSIKKLTGFFNYK